MENDKEKLETLKEKTGREFTTKDLETGIGKR